MTINITIIIQMLNFGIAYILLRFLFFKPTVALLNDEKTAHDSVNHLIADRRAVCLKKEQELDDCIQSCRQFFKINKPHVRGIYQIVFKELTPSITVKSLDNKIIQDATEQIKRALIKRVEHVS